ncbi:MAG: ATP-binding protein [Halopseudomonas aestusnigri]
MVDTIIRNLINNAIKYTPEQGEVVISARHKDAWVEIEVSDTGVGISDEQAARLFQLDKNTTTTGTSGETGTGLGLYLCKDFVERQGGHISLESTEGKGTKFSFKLPVYHGELLTENVLDQIREPDDQATNQ